MINHADGIFLEQIGRYVPIVPVPEKIGENRKVPESLNDGGERLKLLEQKCRRNERIRRFRKRLGVVDSFLDAVKAALSEQHNIEVRGFGTFKIRQRKTRMARNPRTGDPVEVAARPVPVFKPSKELRAMVADASERVSS